MEDVEEVVTESMLWGVGRGIGGLGESDLGFRLVVCVSMFIPVA